MNVGVVEAPQSPLVACAAVRRRFPVGAGPTRQPLQPEATGAAVEVTKWLKPSEIVMRRQVLLMLDICLGVAELVFNG
jgi:hypothetical protein